MLTTNFYERNGLYQDDKPVTNYSPDEITQRLELVPLMKQLKADNIIIDTTTHQILSFNLKSKHEQTTTKQTTAIPKPVKVCAPNENL